MKTRPSLAVGRLAWAAFSFLNFYTRAEVDSLPEVYIWPTAAETLEPAPNTRVSPGEFTITRIGNTNEPLLLFVEFSGTATFGQDYQEVSPYLVMPAGASKLTLLVAPLDDSAVEGDETVIATLSTNPPINSLPNYTVHSRLGSATVVIHDNDFPEDLPVVSIGGVEKVPESCPANADCAGISFVLRRTGPGLDRPLTVFVRYRGTATADVDYPALPGLVTFEAGRESALVSAIPIDDKLFEGDETIIAEVIPLVDYHVDPNHWQATTILLDDEAPAPPVVSLELVQAEAMETRPDQNAIFWAEFRVLRTGPATNELVVFLDPTQGTARLGEDYRLDRVNDGSSVRFLPGQSSVNVRLYPIDDDFYEGDETVFVHLTAPPYANPLPSPYEIDVAHSAVAMVIHDNDPATNATIASIEAVRPIAEEDSLPFDRLPLVGVFRISRTGPTNSSVSVFVQYSGSATPGVDYPFLPWIVTIPAGAASTEIRVMPTPDATAEGLETLVATISSCPPITDPPLGMPCIGPPIDPAHASATVFIRDDGVTRASLVITSPREGAHFEVGETIPISATAIDLDGYIGRVEFFDGAERIGESEIVFFRAPDPGTPIVHRFEWLGASPGTHELTAHARASSEMAISSGPVHVTVGPLSNEPPRVTIVRPADGAEFPLNTSIEIVAEANDPDGYARKAEFFADGRKIGESRIEFILPPPPGQTQTFTFVWRFPSPGPHALAVRATDNDGAVGSSGPVEIRVTPSDLLPVLTVTAPDAFAVEPSSNTVVNTALFRIRRFGPTNDQLVVAYSLHGTAENDVDYEMLSGRAILAPGQRTARVTVRALADALAEGIETVILRLEEPPAIGPTPDIRVPAYRVGFPGRAVVLISDGPWLHSPTDTRCIPLPDGLRHLCFGAQSGQHFRVEASSDLRNWETLCTAFAADDAVHHVDDETQNFSSRFYRLSLEPVLEPED